MISGAGEDDGVEGVESSFDPVGGGPHLDGLPLVLLLVLVSI